MVQVYILGMQIGENLTTKFCPVHLHFCMHMSCLLSKFKCIQCEPTAHINKCLTHYESVTLFCILLCLCDFIAMAFLMTTIKPEQMIQIELMRFNPKKRTVLMCSYTLINWLFEFDAYARSLFLFSIFLYRTHRNIPMLIIMFYAMMIP